MFDRIALINLDKRKDRLGSFKAKIIDIPLFKDFIRYRAVHGDTVTVPGFFVSGGGAWGCRQSHLQILQDAMMDNIDILLVLEDDVRFCPNFTEKLIKFMRDVPSDWNGLMLGGQDHNPGPAPTDVEGIVRSRNTQRTHAYVVRGKEAMQDLYRIWAASDRHIDHLFAKWQCKWNVYQPQPFLCGQDETASDISGRNDTVRYWNPILNVDHNKIPINLLLADRVVAEGLRNIGFHFGHSREPLSGKDKGLLTLQELFFPQDDLQKWVDMIVGEATDSGDVPGIWHPPEITEEILLKKLVRPVNVIKVESVNDAVNKLPILRRPWIASKILWCWRGSGFEVLEGLNFHGFHRGYWVDDVTGLDQGIRQAVEVPGKYHCLKQLYRQLEKEISTKKYGKALFAHPDLNMDAVKTEFPDKKVVELVGMSITELIECFNKTMDEEMTAYGEVLNA